MNPTHCPKCHSGLIYDDWGETACMCGKRFYPEPLPFIKYNTRSREERHEQGLKAWRTRRENEKRPGVSCLLF